MTRDPRFAPPPEPLDDAEIETLVRDVAGAWSMPPVRLDAPSWRERVRSPGARRLAAAGGWLGRVGQAATAAIALTVVAALVAIVVTRSPDVANPGPSSTPGATDDARATSLPRILVQGDLPVPSTVLVQNDFGGYHLVDLAEGDIAARLSGSTYTSSVQRRTDGTLLCLCVMTSDMVSGQPTTVEVSLTHYRRDGSVIESNLIASLTGEPDPRDVSTFIPERPPHVVTALSFSDQGHFGFVGWSVREHPSWKSGVHVVDLEHARIVSSLEFPSATSGQDDARRVVDAPRVVSSPIDGRLLVAREWYEWSPPAEIHNVRYVFDNDVFRVSFSGGILADLAPEHLAADCGERIVMGGQISSGGTWLACQTNGNSLTTIRRITEGGFIDDERLSGSNFVEGDTVAMSRDGTAVFSWDPGTSTLRRVDLESGETTTGHGLTATAEAGPLAAVGAWLAPSAAAKSYLRSSIVVSPDGSRVYAIGVKQPVDLSDMAGSAGVFVFDAGTLETIATYQPTADFISLALSADGRFAYALGLPGHDAAGRMRISQQASITVFDTSDGSVRLIAGALGGDMLTFPESLLD